MPVINNIKSFVMKESYDYDRPDSTFYNFHPQLRICFAIQGVFYNNQKSKIRFIVPVLSIILGLIATGLELMIIWHGLMIQDYAIASECFCYVVILGSIPIVYSSIMINSKLIIEIMDKMNKDFIFISKLGSMYRKPFLKTQLLIWKLCWAWCAFSVWLVVMYIGNTMVLLLYQSLLAKEVEDMVRPLIFPLWLPKDDVYRTPNYEAFMVLEIVLLAVILTCFGVYVYVHFHILLHYYGIMDLIILEMHSLFDGMADLPLPPKDGPIYEAIKDNFKAKIKRIVKWHNSVYDAMDTISTVHGPTLVYQVMLSSVAICIMAFQVAEQLEYGKYDYISSILCFGTSVQLWIPCYLGTLMRNKAFSIGDACWNCGWERTPISQLLRTDLTIIMLCSQKPLTIKFAGLPNLTLETFSSVMNTSYSYFNMLRQSTK